MYRVGDYVRFTSEMLRLFEESHWDNIDDKPYKIIKVMFYNNQRNYNLLGLYGNFAEECFEQPNKSKSELVAWIGGDNNV